MSTDLPIARLRPGGRDNSIPARSQLVPVNGQQPKAVAPLREWHAMTSKQREAAWKELVEWVVWLHDRYELATETRIPKCWTEHPGLVEELFALKVWREQIYTAEAPSGQAARYWHNEMRQVVQAAASFYAKGCRAGHKPPGQLADADEALQNKWLTGDPLTGIPPRLITPDSKLAGTPATMTDPQMRAAIDAGLTRPIDPRIGEYQHYQGIWWMPTPGTGNWQQIADPGFAAELDTTAKRMAMADALVEEHQRHNDAP